MKSFVAILIALILVLSLPSQEKDSPQREDDVPVTKPKKDEKVGRPDDVPVVQPLQPKQEITEQPLVEQATLPINLVKNRIENMKIGSSGYVPTGALQADGKRKLWLNPYALFNSKSQEKSVLVRRDTSGYHVVLENTEHQWEAEDGESNNWLPVRSITVKSLAER